MKKGEYTITGKVRSLASITDRGATWRADVTLHRVGSAVALDIKAHGDARAAHVAFNRAVNEAISTREQRDRQGLR